MWNNSMPTSLILVNAVLLKLWVLTPLASLRWGGIRQQERQ
ncbi:MAG: hypothetical protein V7K62_12845 [Nostoc sp.]